MCAVTQLLKYSNTYYNAKVASIQSRTNISGFFPLIVGMIWTPS